MLLADDHSIVRRGMRALLESEPGIDVVAEAADGLEAVRLCEEHHPDLLILDVAMPKLNGIEVAARAQKMDPAPRAIILSMHADESYVMRSIYAGARAYLLKDATDEDLLPAIRAVAAGKSFFSPAVTGLLVARASGMRGAAVLISGAIALSFGVVIVALKIAVH